MADKRLIATAPLVLVKDGEGAVHYVYENGPIPAFVTGAQKDRLLGDGLISEVEQPEADGDGDDKKPARKSAAAK